MRVPGIDICVCAVGPGPGTGPGPGPGVWQCGVVMSTFFGTVFAADTFLIYFVRTVRDSR